MRAFLRESLRNGLAYSAGSSRNNRRLAFKPRAMKLFPFGIQKRPPLFV